LCEKIVCAHVRVDHRSAYAGFRLRVGQCEGKSLLTLTCLPPPLPGQRHMEWRRRLCLCVALIILLHCSPCARADKAPPKLREGAEGAEQAGGAAVPQLRVEDGDPSVGGKNSEHFHF
jgi:hypothetical protein